RVLWAGLEGRIEGLAGLRERLEGEFEKVGFEREKREFKPHLTIVRIKVPPKNDSWLKTLEGMKERSFGETQVDHLILYKSELTKEGPVYTALKVFPF
ncbi:MAG: RNA 2',3'-cyclic phosphodiesterase, partial [bacterium]|nr:RNA 2',3'-cyclic phosphodiesterase [bacterium]